MLFTRWKNSAQLLLKYFIKGKVSNPSPSFVHHVSQVEHFLKYEKELSKKRKDSFNVEDNGMQSILDNYFHYRDVSHNSMIQLVGMLLNNKAIDKRLPHLKYTYNLRYILNGRSSAILFSFADLEESYVKPIFRISTKNELNKELDYQNSSSCKSIKEIEENSKRLAENTVIKKKKEQIDIFHFELSDVAEALEKFMLNGLITSWKEAKRSSILDYSEKGITSIIQRNPFIFTDERNILFTLDFMKHHPDISKISLFKKLHLITGMRLGLENRKRCLDTNNIFKKLNILSEQIDHLISEEEDKLLKEISNLNHRIEYKQLDKISAIEDLRLSTILLTFYINNDYKKYCYFLPYIQSRIQRMFYVEYLQNRKLYMPLLQQLIGHMNSNQIEGLLRYFSYFLLKDSLLKPIGYSQNIFNSCIVRGILNNISSKLHSDIYLNKFLDILIPLTRSQNQVLLLKLIRVILDLKIQLSDRNLALFALILGEVKYFEQSFIFLTKAITSDRPLEISTTFVILKLLSLHNKNNYPDDIILFPIYNESIAKNILKILDHQQDKDINNTIKYHKQNSMTLYSEPIEIDSIDKKNLNLKIFNHLSSPSDITSTSSDIYSAKIYTSKKEISFEPYWKSIDNLKILLPNIPYKNSTLLQNRQRIVSVLSSETENNTIENHRFKNIKINIPSNFEAIKDISNIINCKNENKRKINIYRDIQIATTNSSLQKSIPNLFNQEIKNVKQLTDTNKERNTEIINNSILSDQPYIYISINIWPLLTEQNNLQLIQYEFSRLVLNSIVNCYKNYQFSQLNPYKSWHIINTPKKIAKNIGLKFTTNPYIHVTLEKVNKNDLQSNPFQEDIIKESKKALEHIMNEKI